MSLKDEIRTLSGNKRKFFLLRIADLDTATARKLTGVTTNTYNSWMQQRAFVELYRRRDEFNMSYKQEAIQILRRDNQLEAVLLEGKIIAKMKEELESGEYNLLRTNLSREVYSKLISDLDIVPKEPLISWEQRINNMQVTINSPEQIGETVDGQFKEISKSEKPEEGKLITEGEPTTDEPEEVTEEEVLSEDNHG